MTKRVLAPLALALASLVGARAASADVTSVDLSHYSVSASYFLPVPLALEASAVAYNWDTDTLFVLGDEGDALVEVTKQGALVGSMTMTGFDDTEGLTYIGGGQFVLAEERLRDLFLLTYSAGGTVARSSLQSADLGATVGNIGIEGVSFDPRDGTYVTVKEVTPQEVNRNTVTFGSPGTGTPSSIFNPAGLGLTDLSDVQVLAQLPSLIGTPDENNLLIFSQESRRLVEVASNGTVLSAFELAGVINAEGITIDRDGNIYIVDENDAASQPRLFVLSPVPLPASLWLLSSALAGCAALAKRRRSALA